MTNRRWFARFEWKPQDCWVGVFWKRTDRTLDVWVCVVPMVPLHFGHHERYVIPSG